MVFSVTRGDIVYYIHFLYFILLSFFPTRVRKNRLFSRTCATKNEKFLSPLSFRARTQRSQLVSQLSGVRGAAVFLETFAFFLKKKVQLFHIFCGGDHQLFSIKFSPDVKLRHEAA